MVSSSPRLSTEDWNLDDVSLTSTVEEGEFCAEHICAELPTQKDDEFHYPVKWEHWPLEASTLESMENLLGCPELLEGWEADKLLIKAGKKQPFDFDAWCTANEKYKNDQALRKRRRAKKRLKERLPIHTHGSAPCGYPESRPGGSAAPSAGSTAECRNLAQPFEECLNRAPAILPATTENNQKSQEPPARARRGFATGEINDTGSEDIHIALSDDSSKQHNRSIATIHTYASISSKPTASTIEKRKASQLESQHTDALHFKIPKPSINAAASANSMATTTAGAAEVASSEKA